MLGTREWSCVDTVLVAARVGERASMFKNDLNACAWRTLRSTDTLYVVKLESMFLFSTLKKNKEAYNHCQPTHGTAADAEALPEYRTCKR